MNTSPSSTSHESRVEDDTFAATYPHTIENGAGERITFVRRIGDRLEVENLVKPGSGPPMHVHHEQEEALTVEQGRLGYQRAGAPPQFAEPGETVVFERGEAHRFWNAGDDDLRCSGYIQPAGNIEYFLAALYASQRENGGGRPDPFEAAFLARRFRDEFSMAEIPAFVQRAIFPLLVLVGRLLGRYGKYADAPTRGGRGATVAPGLVTVLVAAVLLGSLSASAPSAQAAPKQCPRGKTAWKLDGRGACVPAPRLGDGTGPAAPAMAEAWLLEASRRLPGSRVRLAPPLRRAVPRMARKVARATGQAVGARAAARIAQDGPAWEPVDHVVGRQDLGNGVIAEGRIRGKAFEDGSNELDVEVEMRHKNGYAVRYAPNLKDLFVRHEPVGCPTAAGLVTVDMRGVIAGSAVKLQGRRVLEATTVRNDWRVKARGQVGTDARLQSVAADVTLTTRTFKRGLQFQQTISAPATLTREGVPAIAGTPTMNVSIRSADLSRAQERRAEAAVARIVAGAPETARAIGSIADIARDDLLEAEPGWYEVPNDCSSIDWTPASATVEPGQTKRVTGHVIAKRDGGVASGSIALVREARGRLIPITPAFSPGAPASFIAAGGELGAGAVTVEASVFATSTAGRAEGTWYAKGTPVNLPQRFSGTVTSTTSLGGLTSAFRGSATYTRTSVVRGPDGSLTAWYELTSASLEEAKDTLGATEGCRIEATGSGGYIDSGDLELRVLPGGEVVYGLLYDLKLEAYFAPTDCPPGGMGYDGEISAFLNSRRPGPVEDGLRPAGHGYRLAAEHVQDVTAAQGSTTTASWSLTPGY